MPNHLLSSLHSTGNAHPLSNSNAAINKEAIHLISLALSKSGTCMPTCRLRLVNATLDELAARADDPEEEMYRMDRLGRQYQLDFLQAAARHRHNSLIRPHNTDINTAAAAAAAANGIAAEADAMDTDAPPAAAGAEGEGEAGNAAVGQALPAAMAAAAAAAADDEPVTGNAWGTCDVCRYAMLHCTSVVDPSTLLSCQGWMGASWLMFDELYRWAQSAASQKPIFKTDVILRDQLGVLVWLLLCTLVPMLPTREEVPNMRCGSCHRWLHALCSIPAACTPLEYPADQHWTCPCCGADNTVRECFIVACLTCKLLLIL